MPLEHVGSQNSHRLDAQPLARKALLIVNPHSRRGGETDLQAVTALLQESGFEVLRRESSSPEQCAREIDERGDQIALVIVAGGDGTVSSVAESLYRHQKPLAILPLGTANDLARSLSIPGDLLAAGQLVANGELRRIDLGRVNTRFFFNAVNIGLGSQVSRQLSKSEKKVWGVFSYLRAFWATLARKNAFRASISVDGRRYSQRSIHITVGNGRYYGGGNIVEQNAEIDSGALYLYSIKPQRRLKLIFLAPLLRLGKQRLAKRTFSTTGRRIEIHTSPQLEIRADGEFAGYTPAKLEVIPQALSVYAPPLETSNRASFDAASS